MVEQMATSTSRRGFLGWAGRVGVTTIGAVAGLTVAQDAATADGYCNRTPACCCLKRRNDCPGSGSSFRCPEGWRKRSWTCCWFASGTRGARYGCGECQKGGTSCLNGDRYTCSKYWFINSSSC